MKLRELEATFIVGLFGVILVRGQSVPQNIWIVFAVVIAAFMIIDFRTVASLRLIARTAQEAETRLQETDLRRFRRAIIEWTFGNTKGVQQTRGQVFLRTIKSLSDPIIILGMDCRQWQFSYSCISGREFTGNAVQRLTAVSRDKGQEDQNEKK